MDIKTVSTLVTIVILLPCVAMIIMYIWQNME